MPRALATLLIVMILVLAAPQAAAPQALPYHVDPSARDLVLEPGRVPAIRFLTTADFPPFNYRDASGQLTGFNIDLARAICSVLEVACTVQDWPWAQASAALSEGQGDALLAGLAITPENGALFDFSSLYMQLPGRFVTRLPDVLGFDVNALAGRTVAVRAGSTHQIFLERYLPETRRLSFPSDIAALEAVEASAADAFFGDAMRASFWINDNLDCCGFAGFPYFRPDLFGAGFAAAVPAGNDPVREAIDWALIRLKRDGVLDELYLRWFPVSFY